MTASPHRSAQPWQLLDQRPRQQLSASRLALDFLGAL